MREDADAWQRLAERYGVQWTPTILVVDEDGIERHRVEGFLPAEELVPQLLVGLGRVAFAREQWDDAARYFGEAAERFPASEVAAEAVYWAGVAAYKGGDRDALVRTARDLAARYPGTTWAKRASVWGG